MARQDDRIGPTAHYTAYAWHRLALPHAEAFVTPPGRAMFWTLRATAEWLSAVVPDQPRLIDYLEMRHRCIDAELVAIGPDLIVEIGAGLSRRGITWARGHGVEYVEVDLPHMSQAKRDALRRADLQSDRLRIESHDAFAPDFGEVLASLCANAQRPVVVAEGLMAYFNISERQKLATTISNALRHRGGTFLCDLRAQELGGRLGVSVLRLGIQMVTRGRGVQPDFRDAQEIADALAECGFDRSGPVSLDAVPHLAHLRLPGRVWRADVLEQNT